MVFKFKGAKRMGYIFKCVDIQCVIIHGVDTPFFSGFVVFFVPNSVNDRIPEVNIW